MFLDSLDTTPYDNRSDGSVALSGRMSARSPGEAENLLLEELKGRV
jgi:hypothetical protein